MLNELLLVAFVSLSLRTANIPDNPADYQYMGGYKTETTEVSGYRERENGIIYDGKKAFSLKELSDRGWTIAGENQSEVDQLYRDTAWLYAVVQKRAGGVTSIPRVLLKGTSEVEEKDLPFDCCGRFLHESGSLFRCMWHIFHEIFHLRFPVGGLLVRFYGSLLRGHEEFLDCRRPQQA